ncbi:MAG: hypothetical protein HN348_14340 [Proteobacteria bacterium]|nr:hypothetical protein [Pseudomonadota bacterium]
MSNALSVLMPTSPTSAIRPAAHFLLLPLVVLLHHFGHYGVRSIVYVYCFDDLGFSTLDLSLHWFWDLDVIGVGLSVVVGLALGPHVVTLLGVAIDILGVLLLIVIGVSIQSGVIPYELAPFTLGIPIALGAIGSMMLRCGIYAMAAISIARPNGLLRTSLIFAMVLAGNLSSVIAPSCSSWVSDHFGHIITFGVMAFVLFSALVVALPLLAAEWLPPRMEEDRTRSFDLLPLVAGLCLVVFALPQALNWMAMDFGISYDIDPDLPQRLWAINHLFVIFASAVALLVLLPLGVLRIRFPQLFLAGIGFLFLAVGTFPLALASWVPHFVLYVCAATIAVGECLVTAVLLSRMLGDIHWRLVTAIMAAWQLGVSLTTSLIYNGLSPLVFDVLEVDFAYPMIALSVLASLVAGVTLLAAAWPLYQFVYNAPQEGQPPATVNYRRVARTISEWTAKLAEE